LMAIPGVEGHAVGVRDGEPAILVYTRQAGVAGIPAQVEGFRTRAVVSGMVVAWTDETDKHRPAPLGVSIGHPDITAGTLGFKVRDGSGNPYILSNNHVMANINQASIGDHILQPGAYDGGTDPADRADLLFGGELNVIHTSNPETILELRESDDVQNIIDDSREETFLLVNSSAPPFDDIRARQAVALATPRTLYNQLINLDVTRQADQRFTPESKWYNPDVAQAGDDPEAALALVA